LDDPFLDGLSIKDLLPGLFSKVLTPTFQRVDAGPSSTGVYRLEARGATFLLKLEEEREPLERWHGRLHLLSLAAEAGLAPTVVHWDEERRMILTRYVAEGSLRDIWANPAVREAALERVGRTLRRLHDIPLPAEVEESDPLASLAKLWSGPLAASAVPAFVEEAIRRLQTWEAPASERTRVLSHNDVNPSNWAGHGENLLLVHWNQPGANDPYYDLASIAFFLRLEPDACRRLLTAYEGEPVASLPARFLYNCRLVAVLCGSAFLHLACEGRPATATRDETRSLDDVCQKVAEGKGLPAADLQWAHGLALVKAGGEERVEGPLWTAEPTEPEDEKPSIP
jgi:thiamine kinase-like enzyme